MKISVKYAFAMVAMAVFMVACAPDSSNEPTGPSSPNTPSNPEQPQDPQEPSNPQEPENPSSSDNELLIPTQEGSAAVNDGYTLVWEDLFDEGVLDESVWNVEVNGNGGGNNELQYYRRENITFEAEPTTNRQCLVITARKENYNGRNATSGRLNTKGKVAYQYGKVEALIKLPTTYKGLWPAFWMMGNDFDQVGWPACGELDILEMGNAGGLSSPNKAAAYLNGACHWGPSWDKHYCYGPSTTLNTSLQDGAFHLITVTWDEQYIRCYANYGTATEEKYYEIDVTKVDLSDSTVAGNYFKKPFFIIFNLAVGGNFPGIWDINQISALNADNNYAAKMYIDYVKVYQKK